VTVAGLISQNIYRPYIRPQADDEHYVYVTKITGVAIVAAAMLIAIPMRESVVETILDYFNLTAAVGLAVGMGILWRRMNTVGVFASAIVAAAAYLSTRLVIRWDEASLVAGGLLTVADGVRTWRPDAGLLRSLNEMGLLGWSGSALACTRLTTISLPLVLGAIAGVIGSLLTRPPRPEVTDEFFKKIYVPIGQESNLALPLDEAVPPSKRWLTVGGLFIVQPTRQSWVGFVVTLGICLAMVYLMYVLLIP
jgi:Na+/proline symporter